ncbi:MAG: hypothetical protein AMS17_02865 [Spirochaetes bacterium DG_61]|nr:MAG: hypothetical protein AMS17_02865 [Spirochaetes bacterium DG_61]
MKSIHFVGVSGIGMSALASICLDIGYSVSGSADTENAQTDALMQKGMKFYLGHSASHVDRPDIVVRSAAVPVENEEVREAERRGIPVSVYAEFLGQLMSKKRGIAVGGTHGKTTTTAMTGGILRHAHLDPSVVCGGVMRNFDTNALYGLGDYFIAEACEYQRSFLNLRKWYSIITNIEAEHLDYYRDLPDIKRAFADFLRTADGRGFAVINGDDANVMEVVNDLEGLNARTVGFGEENQYRIEELENRNGYYSFQMAGGDGEELLHISLMVPGRFNCINAALSAVLALNLGISRRTIQESLRTFLGTGRRLEYLGTRGMQHLYTDYAHHPTEIESALGTLREVHTGMDLCVVFQPHQYSRTAKLFRGFVDTLLRADCIILTEIYKQRDSDEYIKAVSSQDLFREIKKLGGNRRIALVRDDEELFTLLSEQNLPSEETGMVVAFLGAGDIDEAARRYAALPL